MDEPIYIHGLRAENFLRLELVELAFKGAGLEIVSGRNAQGKSALLRAIWAALAGREALPDEPVRHGAEKAEVRVDLGDRIVRLRVRPDRSSTLTVESKEGAVFKSPQKILDEIVGSLAFDPTAFADEEPKVQAATLRRMVGLDTADLDARRDEAYATRTRINREVKSLEVQVASVQVPPEQVPPVPVPPIDEVDIAAIAKEWSSALDYRRQIDETIAKRRALADSIKKATEEIADTERRLCKMQDELSAMVTVASTIDNDLADVSAPDLNDLERRMDAAKTQNAAARHARELAVMAERSAAVAKIQRENALCLRDGRQTALAAKEAEADALTRQIDEIDAERQRRLAAASFPLPGLTVDGDMVVYQGHPLSQASSAEQLQVSLAIAAALNPRLRLLLVRAGNDLDSDRLRQVALWASEKGYQVILERVAGDTPVGIVIESGRVLADHR
jgi:hypothetical protein